MTSTCACARRSWSSTSRAAWVRSRDLESGAEGWTEYDKLVLATGARPVRPRLPGIGAHGVHGVQTLDDGQRLMDTLERTRGRRAVVVGATTSAWRWRRPWWGAASR